METMQLLPIKASEATIPVAVRENRKNVFIPTFSPVVENAEVVEVESNSRLPFIEANTKEVTIQHLKDDCIVPVFSKDNEITISHVNFIESVWNAACQVFPTERVNAPIIRVSHIIKGRTPDAIYKPVNALLEKDKTIYYERMMFCFEIPTINEDIAGNRLNLTIGGVRAYNHENLYSKKGVEKFKIFIGFKNLVCCNLCVSTDGYKAELKVMNVIDLTREAVMLFHSYNVESHLRMLAALQNSYMSEREFAKFIGRSRMYQYLPINVKKSLPQILMTDTQIGLVAKAYYSDENFAPVEGTKDISMWNVYNLLTGANKSSYIDNFLDRSNNASILADGLNRALYGENEYSWFIK
jgi:hypothetical protein